MDSCRPYLEEIDQLLRRALPASGLSKEWLENCGDLNASSFHLLACEIESALRPAIEILKRPGKRWRPLVAMLCCEAWGGGKRVCPLLPLIEFPHNGSLIIDDIEDRSPKRRGKEAIHLLYGEDLAINAGNFLYFLPTFLLESAEASQLSERERLQAYQCYTASMRRLHFGQGLDILWHREHDRIPSEQAYLQMCRLKTGALARLAAECAAVVCEVPEEVSRGGTLAWETLGIGFQVADDVRNLRGGNPGKKLGDDIMEGKKSLPFIYFCQRGESEKKRLLSYLKRAAQEGSEVVEEVIALLVGSGVLDEAQKRGEVLLAEGLEGVEEFFPQSKASDLMVKLVGQFVSS